MTHDEFVDLVAAYALDALDPADVCRSRCIWRLCVACRRQLVAIRRASAGIGLGVEPVAPPPPARARVGERDRAAAASPRSMLAPQCMAIDDLAVHERSSALAGGAAALAWRPASASTRGRCGRRSSLRERSAATAHANTLRSELAARHATRLGSRTRSACCGARHDQGQPDGRAEAPRRDGRAYFSASRGALQRRQRMPVLPADQGLSVVGDRQGPELQVSGRRGRTCLMRCDASRRATDGVASRRGRSERSGALAERACAARRLADSKRAGGRAGAARAGDRSCGWDLSSESNLKHSGDRWSRRDLVRDPVRKSRPYLAPRSFQLMIELNTMLNSPWFCQR